MKKWKIGIDVSMTVLLLELMSYALIGEAVHEWLGMGMVFLLVLHHVLNAGWIKNIFRGKYVPQRVLRTVVMALVTLTMCGSMVSRVVLSRHALAFLPISGGLSWARSVHLLSAYWGFPFMSLHLGLHWGTLLKTVLRNSPPSQLAAWTAKICGILWALYGLYAFFKRGLLGYMLLENQFVFLDYSEPLALFFFDYFAILGSFVWAGYYLAKAVNFLTTYKGKGGLR